MSIRRVSLLSCGVLAAGVLCWYFYSKVFVFGGHQVPVPPGDASPRRVVVSYIDALNNHDCGTARRLWVATAPTQNYSSVWVQGPASEAEYWCKTVARLGDVHVDRPLRMPARGRESVVVGVSFDVSWRPFGDDGSLGPGVTTWGFDLVRESAHDPWRISDEGTG